MGTEEREKFEAASRFLRSEIVFYRTTPLQFHSLRFTHVACAQSDPGSVNSNCRYNSEPVSLTRSVSAKSVQLNPPPSSKPQVVAII